MVDVLSQSRLSHCLTTGVNPLGGQFVRWFIQLGRTVWWTIRKWTNQPHTKLIHLGISEFDGRLFLCMFTNKKYRTPMNLCSPVGGVNQRLFLRRERCPPERIEHFERSVRRREGTLLPSSAPSVATNKYINYKSVKDADFCPIFLPCSFRETEKNRLLFAIAFT